MVTTIVAVDHETSSFQTGEKYISPSHQRRQKAFGSD